MQIADVFARFVLDDTEAKRQVEQDLPKAADKGGQAAGKRFGSSMATAAKATIGGLAGAFAGATFAIATKGALELDQATQAFRAETGATAAEAEAASKSIATLYKSNLQGFTEIGATLGNLSSQMQVTGAEAETLAQSFLSFSTATGQDAVSAVQAFDDILDSWNLTAADSQTIMDKLVLSHQLYGGTIADNERTLSALAPAMQAANMSIDDGIALLNLFGAKGIDAQMASAAFAKALTKVKSPAELKAMIADISATADPFLRAEKAADLFGARAGAKLANALKPSDQVVTEFNAGLKALAPALKGVPLADTTRLLDAFTSRGVAVGDAVKAIPKYLAKVKTPQAMSALIDKIGAAKTSSERAKIATAALGKELGNQFVAAFTAGGKAVAKGAGFLDQYQVSAADAAGASEEAASAIENSFGNKVQMVLKQFGGTLAEVGTNFGPLLLGFGALVPMLGPVMTTAGAALGGLLAAALPVGMAALPVLIIAAIVGAIALIAANPEIATAAMDVATSLVDGLVAGLEAFPGWLFDTFIPWVIDTLATLIPQVVNLMATLLPKLAMLWGRIVLAVGSMVLQIIGRFAGMIPQIVAGIGNLVGQVVGLLLSIPGKLLGLGGEIVRAIIAGMADLPGKIANVVGSAFANLKIDIGPFHISAKGVSIDLPSLPSFDVGADLIPHDMVAQVHKGEMIVPARGAAAIRSGTGILSADGGGGGGGVTVNVYNPAPEPASQSTERELRKLAYIGVLS